LKVPQTHSPVRPSFWRSPSPYAAAGILLLATVLAYANSLEGGFVFDDIGTIRDNPTIRQLWPLWQPLSPPPGQGLTSNGRPLVNLSLALNYAIGKNAVRSYHLYNAAIHILAVLVLFGVVRRTLLRSNGKGWALSPTWFAFAVALLWGVHPLLTESVTYIVQRAESMMGLFYLLTLYGFIRGVGARDNQKPGSVIGWFGISTAACLLGMGSKEVMASAPLMVFLYDRTFVGGSFREAWRQRRGPYLALAGTWCLLAYELLITGNRHGTAGFGTKVDWRPYAMTQFTAIVRYLRLCFWPHPLVFDYGVELVTEPSRVVPCALVVVLLLAGTVLALFRRPVLGFFGAWFFVILAMTSSVVPVATQVIAEHRMYLPLAGVVVLTVAGVCSLAQRLRAGVRAVLCTALLLGAAGALMAGTVARNRDYRSEYSIWSSAISGYWNNPRSHSNLGFVLANQGKLPEAMAEYKEALRIHPYFSDAQNNLGAAYFQLGDLPESIVHYREALRIEPKMAGAHYNLGNSLVRLGQVDEGLDEFHESIRLDPNSPEAHYNYATSLVQLRRLREAIPEFQEALRIRPDYTEARDNLATALLQTGRPVEALGQYQEVLATDPHSRTAHFNMANVLVQAGQLEEALVHYRQALLIDPNYAKAHCNLGSALVRLGRLREADGEYREALRLNPRLTEASDNLARVEAYLRANP